MITISINGIDVKTEQGKTILEAAKSAGIDIPSFCWHEKLDLLFDAPEQRHEIHRFADEASHLQSLDRSLQHPDIVSSSRRCVKNVMSALRENDRDHYDSLVGIIGPNV